MLPMQLLEEDLQPLNERRGGSIELAPTHHDEAKETAAEEGQGGGAPGSLRR
jgi:hypothetical protein